MVDMLVGVKVYWKAHKMVVLKVLQKVDMMVLKKVECLDLSDSNLVATKDSWDYYSAEMLGWLDYWTVDWTVYHTLVLQNNRLQYIQYCMVHHHNRLHEYSVF